MAEDYNIACLGPERSTPWPSRALGSKIGYLCCWTTHSPGFSSLLYGRTYVRAVWSQLARGSLPDLNCTRAGSWRARSVQL